LISKFEEHKIVAVNKDDGIDEIRSLIKKIDQQNVQHIVEQFVVSINLDVSIDQCILYKLLSTITFKKCDNKVMKYLLKLIRAFINQNALSQRVFVTRYLGVEILLNVADQYSILVKERIFEVLFFFTSSKGKRI